MKKLGIFVLALACSGVAAAGDWVTTRDTELRVQPLSDGTVSGRLAANTALKVLQRRGGWYEISTTANGRGWLRMFHVRKTETGIAGMFQQAAAVIEGGRSVSRKAQATTGIRGVSEDDLRQSKPDFAAVDRLRQFSTSSDSARRFAAELDLKPQHIALPE